MKRASLLAACLWLSVAALGAERPNIVVFFMDDLGYSDLRIDGAADVRTPHLDRLAREGVRLSDCYAAAPVCTPTRAAFMTGRYQHRVGIESVIAPSIGNADTGPTGTASTSSSAFSVAPSTTTATSVKTESTTSPRTTSRFTSTDT